MSITIRNILCFGDSNTFVWDPDNLTRFDENQRWTRLLAKLLGSDYYVIEEGLGGRLLLSGETAENILSHVFNRTKHWIWLYLCLEQTI